MKTHELPSVAILLATYNGARYIETQLSSLKKNDTPFTLHWLDDHSQDDSREVVRAVARSYDIPLREWHLDAHQGVPGAFFQLLECVEADIYLFCDQDDIWQPGKIDATVASLLPRLSSPALCFSDPIVFDDNEPGTLGRLSDVLGAKPVFAQQESRLFMPIAGPGHTQGFTRPLRDLFLAHKDIARSYAGMHDWWMSLIALASGSFHMLLDAPTTLYRHHRNNFSEFFFYPRGVEQQWGLQQWIRRAAARQAAGFLLAAPTLPPGPKLERLVGLARLVATLDRRQSLTSLVRLARRNVMWPNRRRALWFAAACLCSDVPH